MSLLISFFLAFFFLLFVSVCFLHSIIDFCVYFPIRTIIVFKYSIISSAYSFLSPSYSMLNIFSIPFIIRIALFFLALLSVPFSLQTLAHSITAHCSSVLLFSPLTKSLRHRHTQMSECTLVACSNIQSESFPFFSSIVLEFYPQIC